ncbi:MAG: efflux RND transporter permease subunit [Acidobacteria bacterium]|nr:efflux RND transporter permease subunit [Acidobacteriota bacterium]
MLRALIAASISNRWLILVALAIVSGAGLYMARNLQIDAFPDLTNNQVTVITECGPMSPDEVERLVTSPIETSLMGVPRMTQLRSISKLGLSLVTVVMDDSVDRYFARQLINERLREVRSRLPQGLEPVLGPVATAFGEIYQFTIEGGDLSLLDRKTLQDWVIRPQLRTVPGINEVNSWGGFSKQYTVEVNPQALVRYGLTVRDVMARLSMSNTNFDGGFIEHQSEQNNILGLGRYSNPEDIEQVVLLQRGGVSTRVKDVAKVRIEGALRQGAIIRNTNETVCGMAIMLRRENSMETLSRVKSRLARIQLPKGVRLVPFYDQSEVIDITLATVQRNLLEAGLLVSVILFLFLGEFRAAMIVAMVIPFSMLFGFMGMAFFGISANLMSLGAIDFGMIVDGAVVMMENIIRRVHLEGHRRDRSELISESAQEVSKPILFGVLIIIAVYPPILFLEDLEGRMFRPMAISVVSALFGSLLLALFGVPVIASLTLAKRVEEKESAWLHKLQSLYRRMLRTAMNFRWAIIAAALLVLVGAFISISYIGTEFMPRLDEGMMVIQTKKLPCINVPLSVEGSKQVERILLRFPEVLSVTSKLGRPDVATKAMGVYEADLYVNLKEDKKWLKPDEKEALINRMAKALKEMLGMEFNFAMPMAMRLDETISGVKADVALKIFGEDTTTLERLAESAEKALTGLAGIADLQTEVITGVAEIHVQPDRPALARYGLTIEDVRSAIDTSSGGLQVFEFFEGQRRFPIMLRFPAQYRQGASRLAEIYIKAPGGEQVRLNEIARIEAGRGAEVISAKTA